MLIVRNKTLSAIALTKNNRAIEDFTVLVPVHTG